jgi:uncharacterized RDD family membrane protein YckC
MQQAQEQIEMACSQCRRVLSQSDLVQIAGNWVCGECKTAYLSRVVAGTASHSQWHYGGFWIRAGARFIDGFVIVPVQGILALAFFGAFGAQFRASTLATASASSRIGFQVVSYAIAIAYEVLFLHYRGATLGKMAVGLKVVRSDGESIGWGVAFGRYFMTIVSAFIVGIGYIMAGFDDEKRALHDRVCDTRVIYNR